MHRRWWTYLAALVIAVFGVMATMTAVNAGPRHSAKPDAEEHEPVRMNPNSTTGSCGTERWSVKTGSDADRSLINLGSTTSTTISYLDSIPAPSSLPSDNRIQPYETTVYRLQTTLTEYKLEADSDYHLVLQDGSGNTMIGEIPDPACVASTSVLTSQIQNARSEFDAKYSPTGSFQTANVPVTITGVGFFDYNHGQTGVAPNAIELHAVTDIQFGTSGGGSCSGGQLLGNPGFETGSASPWSATSGVVSNSTSEPPHSGSWDAWMDGYGTSHTDTLSQAVSIPSGCTSSTFSFYLHVDTAETTTSTAYDTLTVQVLNSSGSVLSTLATYSNLNANSGYGSHSFNVGSYAGQTITLKFTGTEDSTQQTSFVVDDTALNAA